MSRMRGLTESEKKRLNAAKLICKVLADEYSIISKPLSRVNIKNIPDRVEPSIRNWLRRYNGYAEVYGSSAMATHSIHARKPQDMDIVIDNPAHAAHALAALMGRKGIKTKVIHDPKWDRYVVQVKIKDEWKDALDIHPVTGHYGKYDFYGASQKPIKKRGINIQRASDQLLRKANAITQRRKDGSLGAPPHRELKDTIDFITTAELLLSSMEVRSKAQLARAKKVREALKVWKSYLARLKGDKQKKAIARKRMISKTRREQFIRAALKKADADVENLVFENGKVIMRAKRGSYAQTDASYKIKGLADIAYEAMERFMK